MTDFPPSVTLSKVHRSIRWLDQRSLKLERKSEEAYAMARSSLHAFETCLHHGGETADRLRDVVLAKLQVGECLLRQGSLPPAFRAFEDAHKHCVHLTQRFKENADSLGHLATIRARMGYALSKDQQLEKATALWREAHEIGERSLQNFGPSESRLRGVFLAKLGLADVLRDQGIVEPAWNLYLEALDVGNRIAQQFNPTAEARVDTCIPYARCIEIKGEGDLGTIVIFSRRALVALGVPSDDHRIGDAERWFQSLIRCIEVPSERKNLAWLLRSGEWQYSKSVRRELSRSDWL